MYFVSGNVFYNSENGNDLSSLLQYTSRKSVGLSWLTAHIQLHSSRKEYWTRQVYNALEPTYSVDTYSTVVLAQTWAIRRDERGKSSISDSVPIFRSGVGFYEEKADRVNDKHVLDGPAEVLSTFQTSKIRRNVFLLRFLSLCFSHGKCHNKSQPEYVWLQANREKSRDGVYC